MINISYPDEPFQTKKMDSRDYIFDNLRKKWLLLTPEEWVRQNFIRYLVLVMNYPASLIAVEKEIRLGELRKRFDILVYNSDHQPWMIVECKGKHIPLTETVIGQVLRYNMSVPVSYLVITNGDYTYGWERRDGDAQLLDDLPVHS